MRKVAGISTAHLIWVLTFVALLLGIGILSFIRPQFEPHSLGYEIARDIGIAFLVAAIVTLIYEFYSRTRFDLERMEGILDTVLGSNIPPDVWEEIKNKVIQRTMIRRDVVVRLKIQHHPQSPNDWVIISLEFSYNLSGLKADPHEPKVEHGLDRHIKDDSLGLPCFDWARIGDRFYEISDLQDGHSADGVIELQQGTLALDVKLDSKDKPHVIPMAVARREVRNLPGSYHLIMTELTQRITFYLDEIPNDVETEVYIRPHDENFSLRKTNRLYVFNGILLPGQGFEIQFKSTSSEQPHTEIQQTC
jgi:hypothetical protein